MYARKPLVWYDTNRLAPDVAKRLLGQRGTLLPVTSDFQQLAGIVWEPYPTPEQLFHWQPQETK